MSWLERKKRGEEEWVGGGVSLLHSVICLLLSFSFVRSQCPWPKEVTELNGTCVCAFNVRNDLSIQCTTVNFTLLMTMLHQRASSISLDLLYLNNTRISVLPDDTFDGLTIENLQLSSCGIHNISEGAFQGLENTLVNLNLRGNWLTKVPTPALTGLQRLKLLDLSANRLTSVPAFAFRDLHLSTLRLGDNELTLSEQSFLGLEQTLKNLNLKGTKQLALPRALRGLPVLAFLDLAQNQIRSLEGGTLQDLHSLTALNVEKNLLQELTEEDFLGVNDTLNSLSLLNNRIREFPSDALNMLTELRVLDIGFNLIREVPVEAFRGTKSLTLLALDGNPLTTLPGPAFTHLNTSLRGLSIGGQFLHCDCRVAWISEWINEYDLQVTSRGHNPQFCAQPPEYRDRSFYQLTPDDLTCDNTSFLTVERPVQPMTEFSTSMTTTTSTLPALWSSPNLPLTPTTTQQPKLTSGRPYVIIPPGAVNRNDEPDEVEGESSSPQVSGENSIEVGKSFNLGLAAEVLPTRSQHWPPRIERPLSQPVPSLAPRPNLVRRTTDPTPPDNFFSIQAQGPFDDEVIVQEAYRKDTSVIIQWDSEVSNILGFRVVYRLFGDTNFKLGPPLAASEREFKIKSVPTKECVVVCVVSLEQVTLTPETEIRTGTTAATHMDTIIIAASATICGTVILAVMVFICCSRRQIDHQKHGIPVMMNPSSPPLASLGTLGSSIKPDWETLSMYSQQSIPRMYHMDTGESSSLTVKLQKL
ncbi:Leucine-rich repeats and immunoglobulin-like domains protein 3-like 2, partial [Homarus americanus]